MHLVLGGISSGKSIFAEQCMQAIAPPWLYVATYCNIGDDDAEMSIKIMKHKERRDARWHTIENTTQLIDIPYNSYSGTLIDCMSMWVSLAMESKNDTEILHYITKFATLYRTMKNCIIVSLDIATTMVPPNPIARRFQALLGRSNQILAEHSSLCTMLIAGCPIPLKQE